MLIVAHHAGFVGKATSRNRTGDDQRSDSPPDPLGQLPTAGMVNDDHYWQPSRGHYCICFQKTRSLLTPSASTTSGGFTGSYMAGLGGKADVTMNDQTYTIRRSAEGFDTDNPSQRTTGTFTIRVAC